MFAKFGRRAVRWNAFVAFVLTFIEAILTLIFVRLIYRGLKFVLFWIIGKPQAKAPKSS
jgi:hypothetical protein